MASSGQKQEINLNTLPAQQLKMLFDQLEEELEILSVSIQTLKTTQERFVESRESLKEVNGVGKNMLIPLNNSVYVPGQLADDQTVLVDIGAGYFVEKSIKEAEEFFSRKIDFLKQQMEKIQPNIQQKFNTKQVVTHLLQEKMMQAQAQQQAAAQKA